MTLEFFVRIVSAAFSAMEGHWTGLLRQWAEISFVAAILVAVAVSFDIIMDEFKKD